MINEYLCYTIDFTRFVNIFDSHFTIQKMSGFLQIITDRTR